MADTWPNSEPYCKKFVNAFDIDVWQAMIDRGQITNLNVVRTGMYYFGNYATALMVQARDGDIDRMEWLLRHKLGVEIDQQDGEGRTALQYAADRNMLANAKLLIDYGANRNLKDNFGNTPADCARKWKSEEMIDFLENYFPKENK